MKYAISGSSMFATNQGVVLTAALAITPGLDVLQTNAGEGETARYAVVQGEQLHLVLGGQGSALDTPDQASDLEVARERTHPHGLSKQKISPCEVLRTALRMRPRIVN